MNMRRIEFFMDNGTKVSLTVPESDYKSFDERMQQGNLTSVFADNQKAGRLGERVTIGVMLAHVVSWQAVKA